MQQCRAIAFTLIVASFFIRGHTAFASVASPLARHYFSGEVISYAMSGSNRTDEWERAYEAEAQGLVSENTGADFAESLGWKSLAINGNTIALNPNSLAFRQVLSLEPKFTLPFPDIRPVHPGLIGPIFDLMTFYVDLRLGIQSDTLRVAGDHKYISHGIPNSWADGQRVLVGEDCIDFDLTLKEIDPVKNIAVLVVRHVPPPSECVRFPALWMKVPVSDTPNNWVQVESDGQGQFTAAAGKETFDVEIITALSSGKIREATLINPVVTIERSCTDQALINCGPPSTHRILRKIRIKGNAQ